MSASSNRMRELNPVSSDSSNGFRATMSARRPLATVMPRSSRIARNWSINRVRLFTRRERAHAVLVLDGAGWHGGADLEVPDNISLPRLPPYAPELNPVENVWLYLRASKLAITMFDGYEHIVEACCTAWNFFATDLDILCSELVFQPRQVPPAGDGLSIFKRLLASS